MFSSLSSAKWTKVCEEVKSGNTFYVDYDRIRNTMDMFIIRF